MMKGWDIVRQSEVRERPKIRRDGKARIGLNVLSGCGQSERNFHECPKLKFKTGR